MADEPSLILTGGVLHTIDPARPRASALAIDGARIAAVGDDRQIAALAGPRTRRIDLAGRTVVPGFNDSHIHLWKEGMLLTQVNARPAAAPAIADLTAAYAARAARTPPGQWIEGRGYDENRLAERRHPTRDDLDRATPDHPAILGRTCGHIIVANSRALDLAGVGPATPDPPGGQIDRDEQGQPTGVLRETAMGLVRAVQPPPSEDALAQALIGAGRACLALGITSIGEPGVDPRTVGVYQRLDSDDRLPVRCDVMALTLLPNGERADPPRPWQGRAAKVDTVKLFSDGGLSGGTAALSIPYRDRHDCGLPRFTPERLADEIRLIYDAGLAVAVHAIGDRVIGEVLDAFAACARTPRTPAPRLRIEHFGLPDAAHLARARALGVLVATQPSFLFDIGDSILRYLPDALVPQCYPFRAMIEAGLTVGFSSDGPVIGDINPLLGMQSAALRRTRSGRAIAPDQAITVEQALWSFTQGSALVSGQSDQIGRLAPGFLADIAILSGDPLAAPVEKLLEIRVDQTIVGGVVSYER